MNRVKEIERINAKDLQLQLSADTIGNAGKWDVNRSWHAQYKDSAYVYVGGLPNELSEGDVIVVCSQFGEVVDVNMPRDQKTGKTKGFAFVCYEARATPCAPRAPDPHSISLRPPPGPAKHGARGRQFQRGQTPGKDHTLRPLPVVSRGAEEGPEQAARPRGAQAERQGAGTEAKGHRGSEPRAGGGVGGQGVPVCRGPRHL